MVERHADALRSLRLLFVDCGTRDQFTLHLGARILSARLDALGVSHTHEEFDDDHSEIAYRYGVSLARISEALAD
jgi:enterochelin esterase family protein